jgi:hypothetical protein
MSKGWTDERRKKQAEMIRKHKPWEKSTGPKSQAGKGICAKNALKHGLYGQEVQIIRALLASNREFLDLYALFSGFENLKGFTKQTDKKLNKIKPPRPSPFRNRGTD